MPERERTAINIELRSDIVRLEAIVDKLTTNIDKIAEIATQNFTRTAVLETQEAQTTHTARNLTMKLDRHIDEAEDQISEIRQTLVGMQGSLNALIERQSNIADSVKELDAKISQLDQKFVTKEQFEPIQKGVYKIAGLALTAIGTAIFTYFIPLHK